MNTRKFTGDMADQIERDRDELIELRAKCKRLEGELHQCQEDRQSNGVIADNVIERCERLEAQCAEMRGALEKLSKLGKEPYDWRNCC